MSNHDYDPNSLPDLLPLYYKRLFPYGPYFKWLNYGGVPKTYFTHREFSFTLKDDVYIRYQSFSDQQELEKEIQKKCPYKIDIGAVFTHRPKEHKTVKAAAFQAQEKELVFDIDMTDYDDVRHCCSEANICKKCWPLMVFAVKIIDRALREDFGFDHLLWVYSGRRGIHCWVCDEQARKLSQSGRTAIAEYLSIVKGGENMVRKVNLTEGNQQHPSIRKAIDIIEPMFIKYASKQQDFMGDGDRAEKVLRLIPDQAFRESVACDIENVDEVRQNSVSRWHIIEHDTKKVKATGDHRKCHNVVEEIMLQYCYPRLDVNVSKGVNHLLKSPFCIHPKTGRVCVPMDPENIEDFDPFAVPTISQICDELNEYEVDSDDSKKRLKDYRQTSLRGPMQVFDAFLKKLESSWKGKLIEQSDLKRDF